MTKPFNYDGTGKLSEAIAELCVVSPKNSKSIAALIAQAKDGLGITTKAKKLPDEVKLAIWRWHYDRLPPAIDNPVETISHDELPLTVDIVSHISQDECVEIISQTEPDNIVEINSQPNQDETVELFTQTENVETISHPVQSETVEIVSQDSTGEPVEIISQYGFNDLVRIAFYTVNKGVKKRQVIALDGFYVNALMLVTGIDKKGVPAWVQQAVDGWADFNPELPITRQVKYLLIRELTHAIRR